MPYSESPASQMRTNGGHSKGCAFATGISNFLLSKGDKVGGMVLLSCFQGDGFSVNSTITSYELEYMYWGKNLVGNCEAKRDWVINTVGMRNEPYTGIKGVDKFGVVITNTDSGTVHGSTNSASVFSQIDNLKK
jgi:hypothetical protein